MENNNNKEVKMYTSSNGTKTPMVQVHSEHLINGLAKRYKEIFTVETVEDYNDKLNEINDIKEEIYNRMGAFYTAKFESKDK